MIEEEEVAQDQASLEEIILFTSPSKRFFSSQYRMNQLLIKHGTPGYLEISSNFYRLLHQIPWTIYLQAIPIDILIEISFVGRLQFLIDLEQCGLTTKTQNFELITFFLRIDFYSVVNTEKEFFMKSTSEILQLQ